MIKIIVPVINLLVVLALQIFPGNISLEMDVPSEVNAGDEFEVKITLNKGDLESFSRFQQEIPAGLTAISGTSANADFTFEDNRVRLIWLRLPEQEEVTVSYRVRVDERLKGTFDLTGQFSYIDNNERKSVDLESVPVTILPSQTIDPYLIVDVNDFEKTVIPYIRPFSEEIADIICIRQKPYLEADGSYTVNLLVNKNDRNQFAKIEEMIPEGYTASSIDPKEAIFTFKDQMAKFLWMNMPMDAYFTVSYKLIPKNQASLPSPAMNGTFSFLVDEKTMVVDIVERDLELLALNRDEIVDLIDRTLNAPAEESAFAMAAQNPETGTENATADDVTAMQTDQQVTERQTGQQPADNQPAQQTANQVPAQEPESTTSTAPSARTAAVSAERTGIGSFLLEPEEGVYYRIQLAAGHRQIDINQYFRNMNLEMEVRRESHNGWQKYSIGSFEDYKEARDYRVHIWNTTPVKDAFVTAYSNGNRITVQEALMITEQKWYL